MLEGIKVGTGALENTLALVYQVGHSAIPHPSSPPTSPSLHRPPVTQAGTAAVALRRAGNWAPLRCPLTQDRERGGGLHTAEYDTAVT